MTFIFEICFSREEDHHGLISFSKCQMYDINWETWDPQQLPTIHENGTNHQIVGGFN